MSNSCKMPNLVRATLPALLLALSVAVPQARANPHVWVEARMAFELEDDRVQGLTFVWRFDDYYSSHTMRSYDLDRDGALGPAEMRTLRADTFAPLVQFDYTCTCGRGAENVKTTASIASRQG